jgi:hypothetical protein
MFHSKTRFVLSMALCAIAAVPAAAQSVMSTGTGPGGVTFTVDGWGMFGGCPSNQTAHTDANFYTASGSGPHKTMCYSAVVLVDPTCPAPGRTLLALTDTLYTQIPSQATNPAVNVIVAGQHIQTVAPQPVCGLMIAVDQRLDGPDPLSGISEGSTFVQTYTIFNPGATPRTFNLVRFTDSDLSLTYLSNRAGASRRLADCVGPSPYTSNKEWVFQFDAVNTPGVVVAIAAEGADASGQPVLTNAYRLHASAVGHPAAAFVSNPVTFLTNTIDNDADGDLLAISPEPTGDYAMFQGLTLTAPSGGTVSAVFRTRWTSMDSFSATPIETQARDIACRTWGGSYSGQGSGPILCVNGQGVCAGVPAATPITISLAAPAAGPSAADYVLFGTFGQSVTGTACGSPAAGDSAIWGPPFGMIGFAAFPAASILASWTGGGGLPGQALVSSLPGIAIITSAQASGPIGGCGGFPIVAVPGLPGGISVTLQAAIADFSTGPLPVTLTNAVTLAVGCPCPVH